MRVEREYSGWRMQHKVSADGVRRHIERNGNEDQQSFRLSVPNLPVGPWRERKGQERRSTRSVTVLKRREAAQPMRRTAQAFRRMAEAGAQVTSPARRSQ